MLLDRFRSLIVALALASTFVVYGTMSVGLAAETVAPEESNAANQPWAVFWVSSLSRAMAACDLIFEAADRFDLAESLEDRLKDYHAFAGIDRKRPLGLMWTWSDVEPPATIFLPVGQIDQLMKTATFDVVGFHQVAKDRYEIERPGSPYHVLLRSGYALLGEEIEAMRALRQTPDQLTKGLRDKYDVGLHVDLRQIPRASKELWIDELKNQIEPWLQPQDDEPADSAALRRAVGGSVLKLVTRLILDLRTITLGGRLDPESHQLSLELTVQSEPGSELARSWNKLVMLHSEFSALINPKAIAGLAINWPLSALGKDVVEQLLDEPLKGARINAGIQVVGLGWGQSTVIAGLHGPEAVALNAAIPQLIVRLEKSGHFSSVCDNADIHRGVVIHSVVPKEIPELLGQLVGPEVEVLIGQGPKTVWLAIGNPETLPAHLQQAIDAVEDAPTDERSKGLLNGRFAVGTPQPAEASPPGTVVREVAVPSLGDALRLTMNPGGDSLKVRLTAEKGVLRLIGLDWARQVDLINAAK